MFHQREIAADQRSIYYPAFDYLRIILALVVVAFHADILTWTHAGNLAVQVFFALSGWLIGGILINSTVSDIPRFYFNRVARIWIPYFVSLSILIAASLLRDHAITPKWYEFVFYMVTFVYNFFGITQNALGGPLGGTGGYLWSVCAEEQFYLLAPILLIVLVFGRSPWLWCALSIGILLSAFSTIFAAITLGVFAASLSGQAGSWHTHPTNMALLVLIAVSLFFGTFYNKISYDIFAPVIGISVVMLFARAGTKPPPFAAFLGGISYALYLNHWLGLRLVTMADNYLGFPNGALSKIAMIVCAILISALLYFLVDVQIKKYRDRLFEKRRGIVLAMAGASLVVVGLFGGVVIFDAPMIPKLQTVY